MSAKVIHVDADEGRLVRCGALDAMFKVDSRAGASTAVLEITMQPGFDAGFHVHDKLEETFYVLEGEVTFTSGSNEADVVTAGPGATLFLPPTIPHRVANRGEAPAKCLLLWSPATQDGSLQELAAVLARGGEPDLQEIAAISARYDTHHISDDAVRIAPGR